MPTTWESFAEADIEGDGALIHVRRGGNGPPLLLLHGFPETSLMWRGIAPLLAERFAVICADLRGYGLSSCPPSTPDHAPYSKRAMAADMIAVMRRLGHERFAVAGHDRGGRVAYRLALDHPESVMSLAVLDIVPGEAAWTLADDRFALGYWPWTLLAQDAPLPERLITGAPHAIVDSALGGWGTPGGVFSDDAREAYIAMLADPARAGAICEEYRAAATLDREHDRADRSLSRRIGCPLLALWSADGPLGQWYAKGGGPEAIWREWATDLTAKALPGGHFFPEERPAEIAAILARFFGGLPMDAEQRRG